MHSRDCGLRGKIPEFSVDLVLSLFHYNNKLMKKKEKKKDTLGAKGRKQA